MPSEIKYNVAPRPQRIPHKISAFNTNNKKINSFWNVKII